MDKILIEKICKDLRRIPWSEWNKYLESEPEWKETKPLLNKYSENAFMVFIIMAGLNAYQLKGRAEKTYWPSLVKWINQRQTPISPEGFIPILESFYQRERLSIGKINRLHKFLKSSLAQSLWQIKKEKAAANLNEIWQSLAKTMKQKPNKKTILFSMKCLALSLMMLGIRKVSFEFPIPVDSRIRKLTLTLGLLKEKNANERQIQILWDKVLNELKKVYPEISMLHLDSYLWQKAEEIIEKFGLISKGRDMPL